jgi:hypothetical protein
LKRSANTCGNAGESSGPSNWSACACKARWVVRAGYPAS